MLGDCAEKKLTLKQRSALATQRTLENLLFGQYGKIRDKLLEAARIGYGSIEQRWNIPESKTALEYRRSQGLFITFDGLGMYREQRDKLILSR